MLPERIGERREGGSPFHREGPMQAKDLDLVNVVLFFVSVLCMRKNKSNT